MNWGALLGGLIGAGIPASLAYMGLRRSRQATDAEAFGPAMLLLYRMHPDRVMMNISRDDEVEFAKVKELGELTQAARERLLIVMAGHPRRRVRTLAEAAQVNLGNVHHNMAWQVGDMLRRRENPEGVDIYRKTYAEADTAMRDLIDANFTWSYPRPAAIVRGVRSRWRNRKTSSDTQHPEPWTKRLARLRTRRFGRPVSQATSHPGRHQR